MASESLKAVRLVTVDISHKSHTDWATVLTKYGRALFTYTSWHRFAQWDSAIVKMQVADSNY
jgi:hypothetical protein